jgi:hypothetical protein
VFGGIIIKLKICINFRPEKQEDIMSVNALPSQGLELKIGSGSPIAYTAIKEVVSFSGPGGAGQVIDVTDLSSSAIEKIMGLPDEGQLSFEINYIPTDTQHIALRTARANQTLTPFNLVFPDTGNMTWAFSGFVTNFSISGGVNAAVKASVTIDISGAVTETP